jgi:molybdopterin-guanine dinucleotide biosynthesis protein
MQQSLHDNNFPDVTGVLLAGGKSRRMGRDKACLQVGGRALFERTLALLQRYFPSVIIAGDRPDLARDGLAAVPDIYPGSALGGLHTGLQAAKTDWIFAAPCDMPYPDPRIVELLLHHRTGVDAVIPCTPQGVEPVFALYHKNCLPEMERLLRRQQYRILNFYQRIRIRYLEEAELPRGWQQGMLNINTPAELADMLNGGVAMQPPAVCIVSKSGSGKTTLLEKLIAELKARGYRVGAVKHDAHSFDIDHPGKDSWRLTQAGADSMLITSPQKIAMVRQNRPGQVPELSETIANYCQDLDIVLTEGFKRSSLPKIEVHRQQRSSRLLCRDEEHDPTLIAVASDCELRLDVPVYDINDANGLCDLIVSRFLA